MPNPRPASKPLLVPPMSKSISSPSRSHSCSSTPSKTRRPPSTDLDELVKPRWSAYIKPKVPSVTITSRQAMSQTRIPRLPSRGKENLRGGGARVVKPVARLKPTEREDEDQVYSTGILTSSSKDNSLSTISKPEPRSPIFITSKTVPDLHNKILAKIRLNKRRSQTRNHTPNQSPCKAPAPQVKVSINETSFKEDSDSSDRESPVSGLELETYLTSMFFMVDTYKTGKVSAGSLLEYLGSLVDLPRLDKWKLEELSRMLDPNKDNRYVDKELWSEVGQAWVEMIMDPENHSENSSDTSWGDVGDFPKEPECAAYHEDVPANISYGSIEGVGGVPGCNSREVELENKVSELRYQLARLGEDKRVLERHLAASEDLGQSLTTELEGSQKQMETLSTSINKGEIFFKEVKHVREVEEQCCSLAQKVEELTKELHEKEDKLGDMEVMMVTVNGEVGECKEREELVQIQLNEERKKIELLEEKVKQKDDQIKREIDAREDVESRLESTQMEVQRLELEMSVKDEEIRNLTETASRIGSVGSNQSSLSSSMVHDVSVDDLVIEENLKNKPSLAAVFTPGKLPIQSPIIRRGPSASSTPHKGRLGSIADELKELDTSSSFPSPFCEKKGSGIKKEVLKFVDRLGESLRKVMVDQVEPGKSRQVMVILNKEVLAVKRVIEDMVDDLPTKDELRTMKENTADLEERLAEANAVIDNLKNDKDLKDTEPDLQDDEMEQVSIRLDAVASLLQTANSALLAVTEDSSVVPECSLETETDLSSWQLDLEGIQLVEWNTQLSRKLVHYTKCGKKNVLSEISANLKSPFPTELSKSPVPNSMLWQSLYNRLEDLQKASEVSRDLLMLAGDSMREQSINQSTSIMYPKTVSCQTESVVCQTKISQTSPTTPKSVCQSSQTDQQSPPTTHTNTCQVENCFCPSSQARSTSTRWRRVFNAVGSMVILLLMFTMLCGLEIDHDLYYPVTWYPLRSALGDWLPSPLVLMSYQTVSSRVW
eukprot:GFUD01044466.1.p1 GENE.GFUD01044466.1~~GFUD01044466.1.p1  ORF type:complete len:1000 (+),score=364.95 GFUD01044466.1:67-3066(+)